VIGLQRPLAYCYKGNLTLTLIISDMGISYSFVHQYVRSS